jgi:hypothetical protein
MFKPTVLAPQEYTKHIERLHTAVEHLFGWLNRISLNKKDPPGQWIPDFIDDVLRLNTVIDPHFEAIQQPYIRLSIQHHHLKLMRGFAFEITRQTSEMTKVPSGNIVIGLYFPPEDYPIIDGVYPIIHINLNDLLINTIQLDGTRRIYKPMGNFWLHKNLATLNQLHVYTEDKPYYVIQISDATGLAHDESIYTFIRNNTRTLYKNQSFGFNFYYEHDVRPGFDPLDLKYTKHCNADNVLSYPYIRAANIIKRCWIKSRLAKRRQLIGRQIRILPDIGSEVLELGQHYREVGMTGTSIGPMPVKATYNDKHNLKERITYCEEALRLLLRLPNSLEVEELIKDARLSLSFTRKQQ